MKSTNNTDGNFLILHSSSALRTYLRKIQSVNYDYIIVNSKKDRLRLQNLSDTPVITKYEALQVTKSSKKFIVDIDTVLSNTFELIGFNSIDDIELHCVTEFNLRSVTRDLVCRMLTLRYITIDKYNVKLNAKATYYLNNLTGMTEPPIYINIYELYILANYVLAPDIDYDIHNGKIYILNTRKLGLREWSIDYQIIVYFLHVRHNLKFGVHRPTLSLTAYNDLLLNSSGTFTSPDIYSLYLESNRYLASSNYYSVQCINSEVVNSMQRKWMKLVGSNTSNIKFQLVSEYLNIAYSNLRKFKNIRDYEYSMYLLADNLYTKYTNQIHKPKTLAK